MKIYINYLGTFYYILQSIQSKNNKIQYPSFLNIFWVAVGKSSKILYVLNKTLGFHKWKDLRINNVHMFKIKK